ncbi:patatin-like phospholipase family protein [Roseinatronobacter monicus]|uniref:Patatin-like phospholipase n=1 Tax=Roseinatronobacter monicus TaxID=393481 RepID=A0A543KBG6_9RHOB|nr:patatin-like phospholipase family protein [Roseinatronobacter monicus]TQM92409.1 patatin-like phospholipase [Roseinatronobacter monicus]
MPEANIEQFFRPDQCRILSLDGGGAKGFYTLGVLREVEGLVGKPLCEVFDLIFGTSTGSIIAALLAQGKTVEEIHTLYCEHVPPIMQAKRPHEKSKALAATGKAVFGDARFDGLKTGVGLVATKWQLETPMIFKNSVGQAHGRVGTFTPGFGCTIADAVQASCSAYPFFDRKVVKTANGDSIELIDGGYCANNPTLYAIADAIGPMEYAPTDLRVLSVGVGNYPSPAPGLKMWFAKKYLVSVQLLQKTLEINTTSMDVLRRIMFKQVPTVRVNETFEKPEMATDMFEHNMDKLNLLRQRGSESYAKLEADIKKLMGA